MGAVPRAVEAPAVRDLTPRPRPARTTGLAEVLVGIAWVASSTGAAAYVHTHPPFPFRGPVPYRSARMTPVIDYRVPAEFRDDALRIAVARVNEDLVSTRIWHAGRLVFDTAAVYPDAILPVGSRIFYHDLTGDGLRDVLVYTSPAGSGLAAIVEFADLLIAQPGGAFARSSFIASAAGPEDFIDANGDGRFEMLWLTLGFAGRHAYWIYRLAEIGERGLRLRDSLAPGFPTIVWFTDRPNDASGSGLSAKQRSALIKQSTQDWRNGSQSHM